MERWYTLHTKPHSEYQVASALQERGIEIYLPLIDAPKRQRGRKQKPFFPCYLFCKMDFSIVGFSVIQWTPGLRRIVAIDYEPVPVPDEMIELVQRKLGEIEITGSWSEHSFEPGDTVRFTDGPFRDMEAIFEKDATSAQRVQVLLDILGGVNRMQVDVADLEKISDPVTPSSPNIKRPRRTRGQGRRIKGNTGNA